MASKRNGTLYTGVTSDLALRVEQHRRGALDGFSKRYGTKLLVWYEFHGMIENAIAREKAVKKWNRQWKLDLIEKNNPDWGRFVLLYCPEINEPDHYIFGGAVSKLHSFLL